jgi:hypothetical protein
MGSWTAVRTQLRAAAAIKEITDEYSRSLRPVRWACQDLNQRPHPYQQNAGNRCAKHRSRRSHSTGEAEVVCSRRVQLCALATGLEFPWHAGGSSLPPLARSTLFTTIKTHPTRQMTGEAWDVSRSNEHVGQAVHTAGRLWLVDVGGVLRRQRPRPAQPLRPRAPREGMIRRPGRPTAWRSSRPAGPTDSPAAIVRTRGR